MQYYTVKFYCAVDFVLNTSIYTKMTFYICGNDTNSFTFILPTQRFLSTFLYVFLMIFLSLYVSKNNFSFFLQRYVNKLY